MAVSPSYPGVYVQEVPSGVRTIAGVSTSITLFIGRTGSGPLGRPMRLTNYSDFVRTFGEDNAVSDVARYVRLFFLNGGTDCYVIRIAHGAQAASVALQNAAGKDSLVLSAKNPGVLGNAIRVAVDYDTEHPESTFNMDVFRWAVGPSGQRTKVEAERWLGLTMDPGSPTYAAEVLSQKSKLVRATDLAQPPSLSPASSLSGRTVDSGGGFVGAWQPLLPPGAAFRISVDRSPFVAVSLDIDWDEVTTAATLASAVQDAVAAALGAAGVLTPAPTVSLEVAGTGRHRLRFESGSVGDVRLASATDPTTDVAVSLMLGDAAGGIEVGAFAERRPVPTAISLRADETTAVFALDVESAANGVVLDELGPTGQLVPVTLSFDLAAPPPASLREKLLRIRDAVNAYQAGHPSTFLWQSQLWGSRLAFLRTGGGDELGAPASFATTGHDVAARFIGSVRHYALGPGGTGGYQSPGTGGSDGTDPGAQEYRDALSVADAEIDLFNILVLPPHHGAGATPLEQLWGEASVFCQRRRAFLLMDPPAAWDSSQVASTGVDTLRIGLVKDHAAVYFPRLTTLESGLAVTVGPAGAVAGLYARTDASRGVWKAPAGTEADLRGVVGVDVQLSDAHNGQINPVGVNAVRVFPAGVVSWGARTMDGADQFASEYKYVPIRRLALFMEESLYRGLQWVVFEPNDEGLWSQIRLNVGAFLHGLYRKGAFQGQKPKDAYFVKCDAETTTQADRNLGVVNIWVGFAPLKPAEFVVLHLQQIAGQLEA